MNKYGLLITSPVGPDKNIGDYIQSLAALQFIPKKSEIEYIEKEEVSKYTNDTKLKCIMNAWYIWHPENWPPKEAALDPLLTSIHISPLTAERMLENGGKEYFIKHGPVGCRDKGTAKILEQHNVPNFFSGCLTLTLGKSYKHSNGNGKIIFVDPYFTPIRYVNADSTIYYPQNLIKAFLYFLKSPKNIVKLSKKEFFKGRIFLQTLYNASVFYHSYSNMFDDEVLMEAEYVSHMVPVNCQTSQKELLNKADELIKKYAEANFVVTSRIHCALPCLGIGTPVIFVLDSVMDDKQNVFNAPGRFDGLLDFFRIASYNNNKVVPVDDGLKTGFKINKNFKFDNKSTWEKYRDSLIEQVEKFIK